MSYLTLKEQAIKDFLVAGTEKTGIDLSCMVEDLVRALDRQAEEFKLSLEKERKYYGKVSCSQDNPMISFIDINKNLKKAGLFE